MIPIMELTRSHRERPDKACNQGGSGKACDQGGSGKACDQFHALRIACIVTYLHAFLKQGDKY